jgi:dTDP-4-dehydrorhamnose reductase
MYKEDERADPIDHYGLTKLLAEQSISPNHLILRTSFIGHQLSGNSGLLEWALSQEGEVQGWVNAFFSGLTTNEIARVMHEHILEAPKLKGIYHLSTKRISKYKLLMMVYTTFQRRGSASTNCL